MSRMVFGARPDGDEAAVSSGFDRASKTRQGTKRNARSADLFKKIVRLCLVRDRSQKELRDRFLKEGFSCEAVDEAIDRASACGLVDDARFAEVLIRSRVSAGKGEIAIRNDLQNNGIDPETLTGWVDGYGLDEASQIRRAVEVLRKRPPTAKDVRSAAYRRLMGKGYSQAVTTKAVRVWSESR